MLAKYLSDHVPGKPNVIVQSMPGAGSIKAANYVYTGAPKDGATLGIFSVGALIDELFGLSTTSFDSTKYGRIGNMDESVGVCVVKSASGVRQFEDLLQKEAPFGGTGPADASGDRAHAALWREDQADQGLPWRVGRVLAMDRGEVHGACGITIAVLKSRLAQQIASGTLLPIIHDAIKPHPELPGVPSVYDFARGDDDRRVLDLLFGWRVLGRPIAAPPGIPPERLAALRKAFLDAMNDARFVACSQGATRHRSCVGRRGGKPDRAVVQLLQGHDQSRGRRGAELIGA
jgi:hypothetical protein